MLSLLAFDTSTEQMHLAVCRDAHQWAVTLPGGAQASVGLLPGIRQLLAQAGLRVADLDAIAFGRGPGAFTGLRTACSVAQGLALAVDRPALPIDTLAVLAQAARDLDPDLNACWAVLDARMNQVYAAPYRYTSAGQDADGWQAVAAPAAYDPAALPDDGWAVVGPARASYPGQWPAAVDQRWVDIKLTPQALLTVARQAWAAGLGVDAALALPVYVRDKVALTTAERAARAAGVVERSS